MKKKLTINNPFKFQFQSNNFNSEYILKKRIGKKKKYYQIASNISEKRHRRQGRRLGHICCVQVIVEYGEKRRALGDVGNRTGWKSGRKVLMRRQVRAIIADRNTIKILMKK
jgi:hypothetical protein